MYSQLFLRVAVATAFLSAVADRFGLWGPPGSANASWGNWANFVQYANQLNFFMPAPLANLMAILATLFEVILAVLLLIGYRTRLSAILSGVLLTAFAITMTLSLGIKSTFNYSVWIGAAACFLLGTIKTFPYSIDGLIIGHQLPLSTKK
ncbi:DoxX family membrane protein [Sphingobacterium sp. N143]|nr:DoxX family membrane protein [Sphingobacterium sp. N143]